MGINGYILKIETHTYLLPIGLELDLLKLRIVYCNYRL